MKSGVRSTCDAVSTIKFAVYNIDAKLMKHTVWLWKVEADGWDDDWEAPALSLTPRFLHTSLFTPTGRWSQAGVSPLRRLHLSGAKKKKKLQCLCLCSAVFCCLDFHMLLTLLFLPSSGRRRSASVPRSARCVNPSRAPCLCATGSATGTCGSPTCSAMIHWGRPSSSRRPGCLSSLSCATGTPRSSCARCSLPCVYRSSAVRLAHAGACVRPCGTAACRWWARSGSLGRRCSTAAGSRAGPSSVSRQPGSTRGGQRRRSGTRRLWKVSRRIIWCSLLTEQSNDQVNCQLHTALHKPHSDTYFRQPIVSCMVKLHS